MSTHRVTRSSSRLEWSTSYHTTVCWRARRPWRVVGEGLDSGSVEDAEDEDVSGVDSEGQSSLPVRCDGVQGGSPFDYTARGDNARGGIVSHHLLPASDVFHSKEVTVVQPNAGTSSEAPTQQTKTEEEVSTQRR